MEITGIFTPGIEHSPSPCNEILSTASPIPDTATNEKPQRSLRLYILRQLVDKADL
jgi:hypothetical protein